MLERTAAGLETGHLHRVLPRSTRPTRHLRQPRTSFSQSHGPASVARRVETQVSRDDVSLQGHDNASPLLDFLYPKRTHPLLRRQSFPSIPLRSRTAWPACTASQRRHESTDPSNRPSAQKPASPAADGEEASPEAIEEEVEREFDHTQWKEEGITIRPKATYSLEENDPPPDRAGRRRLSDTVNEADVLLDRALSETKKFEARPKKGPKPRLSSARPRHFESEMHLVDRNSEKELREHLKEQIRMEAEKDGEFEEQVELSNSVAEPEAPPNRDSRSVEVPWGQEESPIVQEPVAQPTPRSSRPVVPEYRLPKGEEPELPKEGLSSGVSETQPKRRSRFAAPEEEETKPEQRLRAEHTMPEPVEAAGEVGWQAEEAPPEEPAKPLTFYEMLEDVEGAHFHAIYDAHIRLDEQERDQTRPQVIAYLSKSRSIVEAGRVKSLFRQMPVEHWTNDMLSAIVLVFLRSDEQGQAFEAFRTGLRQQGLTGGFEYLLIDSVNKHQWHRALDAWLVYCKDLAEREPGRAPDKDMLKPFASLDSLGGLYFLFERYLAAAERKVERFLDAEPVAKRALDAFRRTFAKAALESYCPPKQARVILDWWYNRKLYSRYIWGMVDRWSQKQINSDTVRELIPIYDDLSAIPNIKVSGAVLSGMYRICYPHSVQTLKKIHEDWVQMHDDLDSWAYKKFMKFYAHRGDAEQVKALWEKYIVLYPEELTHAQSFSSIINAYAQGGDIRGAEAELERMTQEFKIAPDVSIMNAMLKCYMRNGHYEATLACFKNILETFEPEPYMYAHMMAMCAKKGDLDQTIEFFNDAQDRQVLVTKEMVLALVVAYCGNAQIGAAEELTRRLADDNVTSAAIWNQLVLHHGQKARLSKCYKLLDEMKERGIEWDRDTIDNLLQALTQVGQVGPAFQVLKMATQGHQQSIIQPDHYATVMVGAARSRDTATADGVYDLLRKAGLPIPFNALVAYTDLMLDRKPNAKRVASLPREMVESLRHYIHDLEKLDVWKRRQQTRRVSWCIELLIDFRDFDAIEEVVSLYTQLFPEYKDGNLPPDILASLMQGYHRDDNYERIVALWEDSWPRLRSERLKSGEDAVVYPAHEYDLDRLVFRVADAYRALSNPNGLASAIQQVHEAGFRLTTHTWDRVISALAITGAWKTGVRWCETVLMKNWAGWTRRLNFDEKRARRNPRILWPQRRTVLALREGWIAERQLAAWSTSIARSLVNLDIDYPRTVNAFRDALEPDVPGGPWIMSKEITMEELIKPLPLRELKLMDKELTKYLADEEKVLDQKKSPFRVMSEQDDRLRSLNRGEMAKLKGLLDRFLAHTRVVDLKDRQQQQEQEEQQPTQNSASG